MNVAVMDDHAAAIWRNRTTYFYSVIIEWSYIWGVDFNIDTILTENSGSTISTINPFYFAADRIDGGVAILNTDCAG